MKPLMPNPLIKKEFADKHRNAIVGGSNHSHPRRLHSLMNGQLAGDTTNTSMPALSNRSYT